MAMKKFKRRPNKKELVGRVEEKPRYNTVLMLTSDQAKLLLDHLVESVKSQSGVLSEIIIQLRR